jgi:hypothetical protein
MRTRLRWARHPLLAIHIVTSVGLLGPTTEARLHGEAWELGRAAVISAAVVMLVASVALSAFKPGGRLRRSPTPGR